MSGGPSRSAHRRGEGTGFCGPGSPDEPRPPNQAEEYEAVVSSSYGWKLHLFRWDPASGWSVSKCGVWRFQERRAGLRPEKLEPQNKWLVERCRRCFR
jgi:hypothetical protein